ncbi:hypothetical protein ASC94_09875 [Massilia sp. Root418]|uniref:DUF2145 domain-containing protein n=1 Tax=Massilia sp. Root418 TaxID=1736532 RepID=UPI0006F63F70|nr:DUF2145 domain-containing protein [Massilia sp. Root418]KQW97094.1 hypothetical protein ASC94_09875 [Massilia sp. Root418]
MRRTTLACLAAAALAGLALLPPAARAGDSCEDKPLELQSVVKGMDLALRTSRALDESGAQIAFIARAGQDLSKYGLRYSHMALVWRDQERSRWLVVHELNDCGSATSGLFNEGLGNFFLDDMFLYEAQLVIPGRDAQARLARVLSTSTPRRLHHSGYNMLSYAYSTRYQNSNQWVLESYAAASAEPGQVETRTEAQAWLKQAGFRPITVEIPAMTRLGARMFRANVAFDDHPYERRMAGLIDTVTVDSVVRFIKAQDKEARTITIR